MTTLLDSAKDLNVRWSYLTEHTWHFSLSVQNWLQWKNIEFPIEGNFRFPSVRNLNLYQSQDRYEETRAKETWVKDTIRDFQWISLDSSIYQKYYNKNTIGDIVKVGYWYGILLNNKIIPINFDPLFILMNRIKVSCWRCNMNHTCKTMWIWIVSTKDTDYLYHPSLDHLIDLGKLSGIKVGHNKLTIHSSSDKINFEYNEETFTWTITDKDNKKHTFDWREKHPPKKPGQSLPQTLEVDKSDPVISTFINEEGFSFRDEWLWDELVQRCDKIATQQLTKELQDQLQKLYSSLNGSKYLRRNNNGTIGAGSSTVITRDTTKTIIKVWRLGDMITINLTNNTLTGYLRANRENEEKPLSATPEEIIQIKRDILKWIIYTNKKYSEEIKKRKQYLTPQ